MWKDPDATKQLGDYENVVYNYKVMYIAIAWKPVKKGNVLEFEKTETH